MRLPNGGYQAVPVLVRAAIDSDHPPRVVAAQAELADSSEQDVTVVVGSESSPTGG